jgi:hypothetical protein
LTKKKCIIFENGLLKAHKLKTFPNIKEKLRKEKEKVMKFI